MTSKALGALLAGGRTRDQANTELDTLAEADTDRVTEASRTVSALPPGRHGPVA